MFFAGVMLWVYSLFKPTNPLNKKSVNRVGIEKSGSKKIEFWGSSFVIDPSGNIIGKLKSKKEDILICNIDFKKVENGETLFHEICLIIKYAYVFVNKELRQ